MVLIYIIVRFVFIYSRVYEHNMSRRGVVAKVVNGDVVQHLAFRFFVTVFVTFSEETHLCGGVIYDRAHVLTAGHCLHGGSAPPDRIVVRAFDNTNIFDKYTQDDYDVSSHAVHPLYDETLLHNDYAILRVVKNFTFGVDQIVFASSRHAWEQNAAHDAILTIGHGVTETGKPSAKLRIAKLARVPTASCGYAQETLGHDFCARSFYPCENGKCQDSCQGDSGGPLFQTKLDATAKGYHDQVPEGGVVLFGLTSRGGACGSNTTPGIYSPVYLALDWLQTLAATSSTLGENEAVTSAGQSAGQSATEAASKKNSTSLERSATIYFLLVVTGLCLFRFFFY
jgi:secreted trypsin-like serine protease